VEKLEAASETVGALLADLTADDALTTECGFDLEAYLELQQAFCLLGAARRGLEKAAVKQTRAIAADPLARNAWMLRGGG
jgi:hypothetical protein